MSQIPYCSDQKIFSVAISEGDMSPLSPLPYATASFGLNKVEPPLTRFDVSAEETEGVDCLVVPVLNGVSCEEIFPVCILTVTEHLSEQVMHRATLVVHAASTRAP